MFSSFICIAAMLFLVSPAPSTQCREHLASDFPLKREGKWQVVADYQFMIKSETEEVICGLGYQCFIEEDNRWTMEMDYANNSTVTVCLQPHHRIRMELLRKNEPNIVSIGLEHN